MNRQEAIDLDNDSRFVALKAEMDRIIKMESEKLLHANAADFVRLQERVLALRFAQRFPQLIAEREEDDTIITPGKKG